MVAFTGFQSNRTLKILGLVSPVLAAFGCAASAYTDEPADPLAWTLNDIDWPEPAADGTKYRVLEGSRENGTFSYAFFIPAGLWDPAHWHSQAARVFVAEGELRIGYGIDSGHADIEVYPAGSFLVVPANAVHFDGAEVDTTILGVASGPWSATYADDNVTPSAGTPD